MAGIAQVWLTHNELEALAEALDREARHFPSFGSKHLTVGRDKIELALKPVACEIASGPK